MRINELVVENQLDEGPIGNAIAKGVGGLARGIGTVAGGIHGALDAGKQGYAVGRAAVSGVEKPLTHSNGRPVQPGEKYDAVTGKPLPTPAAPPAPGAAAEPEAKPATPPAPGAAAEPEAKPATPPAPTPSSAEQTAAAAKQHRADISSAQVLKSAAQAALSKPGFQRTANDQLAISKAKQAGIELNYSEARRIRAKIIREMREHGLVFHSKFLGQAI